MSKLKLEFAGRLLKDYSQHIDQEDEYFSPSDLVWRTTGNTNTPLSYNGLWYRRKRFCLRVTDFTKLIMLGRTRRC